MERFIEQLLPRCSHRAVWYAECPRVSRGQSPSLCFFLTHSKNILFPFCVMNTTVRTEQYTPPGNPRSLRVSTIGNCRFGSIWGLDLRKPGKGFDVQCDLDGAVAERLQTNARVPALQYFRHAARLKPLSSAVTSVFISTFAMFSVMWTVFLLVAGALCAGV
ncbi:hypothetical protein C8R45DRAFT_196033 [Mycena sanguinolenta]|nr:hypothetical protein C8R45DRAFT_196033 [Mycena sanguinolenta]